MAHDRRLLPISGSEWKEMRRGGETTLMTSDIRPVTGRIVLTLDALFEYRERTKGYYKTTADLKPKEGESLAAAFNRSMPFDADDIAKELGIE